MGTQTKILGKTAWAALFPAIVVFALAQAGCLRYVPTREEISRQDRSPKLAVMGGPDEFYSYEEQLKGRLRDFIRVRSEAMSREDSTLYRIGPGDSLEIQVYGLPELTTTAEVAPDEMLYLPLLGAVRAGGRTVAELRGQLASELERYVRAPRISIAVKDYGNRVSVIGAVMKPGTYPLKYRGSTLTELLALAGGRSDRASSRVVLVPVRSRQAPSEAAKNFGVEVDMQELVGGVDTPPLNIPLLPGDTIIVPEVGTFKVDGEVIRAGSFPLAGRTTALGAVAAAGGFTYSAKEDEVEVIRDLGGGRKASLVLNLERVALNGDKDVVLRDGDVVRVPSDPGRFRTRQFVEAIQGFFRGSVSTQVRSQ